MEASVRQDTVEVDPERSRGTDKGSGTRTRIRPPLGNSCAPRRLHGFALRAAPAAPGGARGRVSGAAADGYYPTRGVRGATPTGGGRHSERRRRAPARGIALGVIAIIRPRPSPAPPAPPAPAPRRRPRRRRGPRRP